MDGAAMMSSSYLYASYRRQHTIAASEGNCVTDFENRVLTTTAKHETDVITVVGPTGSNI